ncbi:MAG: hypothetical protein LBQ93_08715 [Treponema sp.]|jgi:hypothetical protein|nr:hypothetical protein [Treponema sp.]
MDEQQFLTPKDVLGYVEEHVFLGEDRHILNYSLSNSLDDIEIAIYARTGLNIDLNNAYWELWEPWTNIKHLMNKHHVTYSMTTWYEEEEKRRYLSVHMRVGDKWFGTRYNEKNGLTYNYEKYQIFDKIIDAFNDPDIDDPDTAINDIIK